MAKDPYVPVSVHIPQNLKADIEKEAEIAGISPGELYRTIMFLGLSSWAELSNKLQVSKKVRKGLQ